MKNQKDHRGSSGEERQRWHEWGVSEVIGVVLLLSLVVVGGTVVGTQLLSQPAPKEIPNVNFLANYDSSQNYTTLYHTGGDTLRAGDYHFIVQYSGASRPVTVNPTSDWQSGQPLPLPDALGEPAKVTLVYTGNGAGDTALRSVVMGDMGSDAEASTTTNTTAVPTTVIVTPTTTTTPTITVSPTETTIPTTTPTTTVPTTVTTTPTVTPTATILHTVTVISGQHGQVLANEKTITAGTTGSISVEENGQVNFTFTPTIGYHLANVNYTTDTSESGTFPIANNAYTLSNVTRNYSVTASFAINTCTINVSASQGGTVTAITSLNGTVTIPAGTAGQQITVNYGEQPNFTFTPDEGSHIADVAINGTAKGPIATYTFPPVTDNSNTVAATFAANVYAVNVTSGQNGSVTANDQTVNAGTTETVNVRYNGQVNFTYLPVTGHHIDTVSYTAEDGSLKELPIEDNASVLSGIKSNTTVVANFAIDRFAITVNLAEHGTITPNGTQTVDYNSTPTFTFTPDTGYHLAGVTVDETPVTPAKNTYTFPPVTAPHTLEATFAIDTFTINATVGDHGAINPNGTITVNYGDSEDFTITADTGYHITNVTVDSTPLTVPAGNTSYPYTFSTITSDHTINASFGINTYTINATAGEHGTITPNGTLTVNYGDSETFTITPETGYKIADVKVDDVSQGAVTTYDGLTNIQSDHTISASFEQITYTINAYTGPLGMITPYGSLSYAYHATPSFTVGAIPGYHIANLIVDGQPQGPAPNYTFSQLEADHTITANFDKNVYTIAASANAGGSITPEGIIPVEFGDNQTFTIVAGSGNNIDDVVVDGVSQGPVNSFTFPQVDMNHTIQAFFDINGVGPYVIEGYVSNGIPTKHKPYWDASAPRLAGWTVQALVKGQAQDWYVIRSAVTDENGYYRMDHMPKDHYHVRLVPQPGWEQTYPSDPKYYDVTNLNNGHQDEIDNFMVQRTSTAGNLILMNDWENWGVLKSGTYIEFKNLGENDYIEMDSGTISVPKNSNVKIAMNGDQTTGLIWMVDGTIYDYEFDNVIVYLNGIQVATGSINDIWMANTANWHSTLTYSMMSKGFGASLLVDNRKIIDQIWWTRQDWGINVYGISPDNYLFHSKVLHFYHNEGATVLVCSGSYDLVNV